MEPQTFIGDIAMIDILPFGYSIYKVHFPHPIIYTFNLTGLFCFVWAKDLDREYGKHESNRDR
jgi:hypothetical protein